MKIAQVFFLKVFCSLFLIVFFALSSCLAEEVKQQLLDLITNFDSVVNGVQATISNDSGLAQEDIKKFTDDIQILPLENQKKFIDQVATLQSTIESQIKETQLAINTIASQVKSELEKLKLQVVDSKLSNESALQRALSAVASAQNQFGTVQLKLKNALGLQLNKVRFSIQQAVSPYKQQYIQKKIMQAEKDQQAHREKIRVLMKALTNALPKLKEARLASQQMLNEFSEQGVVSSSTIASVSRLYRFALRELSKAYNVAGMSIDFNDKSNLVSIAQKEFARVFLNDISRTVNKAQELLQRKKKDEFLQVLYQLVQRLNGVGKGGGALVVASGYEAAIRSFAQEFFTSQQEAVVQFFVFPKKQMTLEIFQKALEQIVSIETLQERDVRFATAFINQIGTNFSLMDPNSVTSVKKQAESNYALIFIGYAHSLLGKYQKDENNDSLLLRVANAYGQAATFFSQAQDQANALQYQKMHDSLKNAIQLEKKAVNFVQMQRYSDAIQAYEESLVQYNQAGALESAHHVSKKMLELQLQQSKSKAVNELVEFMQQARSSLQSYMLYISQSAVDLTQRPRFEIFLVGLAEAAQKSLEYLTNAAAKTQELSGTSIADIQSAIEVLSSIKKIQELMLDADQFIIASTLQDLATVQNNYFPTIIQLVKKIDSELGLRSSLDLLLPLSLDTLLNDQLEQVLSKGQRWSFSLLIQRHFVKLLFDTALQINDSLIKCQFVSAAELLSQQVISEDVQKKIKQVLDQCSQQKDQVAMIVKQAEEKKSDALKMSAQSWAPLDQNSVIYESVASNAWKDSLRLYLTAYQLGDVKSEQSYARTLVEYLSAYKKNSQDQFSSVGAATIAYRLYAFYKERNNQADAQGALKTIEESLNSFFQATQFLYSKIEQSDLIQSATTNQETLTKMLVRFDQLMTDQQAIASQLAPSLRFDQVQLFDKKVDGTNGIITISMGLFGQQPLFSFKALMPNDSLARIYKLLGEYYFAQNNYLEAAKAFKQAIYYLNLIGQTDLALKLNDVYQLVYTRSLIDAYVHLIIPNDKENRAIGNITLAGITAPERYLLYSYIQEIPSYIPFVITPDQLKTLSAEQLTEQLTTYAFLLYMDKVLKENGIQYAALFDGVTLRSSFNVSSDQIVFVQSLLDQGAAYIKNLKDRIAKQESFLRFTQRLDASGQSVIDLYELYKPISNMALPGISITKLPYTSFPTVQFYYGWARKLADPSVKTIPTSVYTYVSASDPKLFNHISQLMAEGHISAAFLYQKRINYLMNGGDIELIDPMMTNDEKKLLKKARDVIVELKKINKGDISIQLANYLDTYQLIQTYIQSIVMTYCSLAVSLYSDIQDKQKVDSLNLFINGDLYQLLGDLGQLFLVGDPRDQNYFWGSQGTYGGILIDIKNYYLTAATAYGSTAAVYNSLINKSANLFISAGDILVTQKNYFAAITFYSFAVGAIKSLQPIDQKMLDSVILKWLGAYYRGASSNMMIYRNARLNPLQLTLSTGQQITENLTDLIARSDIADPVEQEKVQSMKEILLDALIYFMGGSLAAEQSITGTQSPLPSQNAGQQSSAPKNDPVAAAAEKIVKTYSTQAGIRYGSLDDVLAWFTSDNFEKTLFGAFDFFSQIIVQAQDNQARQAGYRAFSSWMNNLCYDIFGKIYMQDYLGGISTDTLQIFLKNISDEAQNIIAPSSQWVN